MSVLFADVTGSTTLGERLDPEQLRDVMATYFGGMREEIEAEGGTVEKFIGDAVMAAFGVPSAHEDDPARALRAAIRMRRRLEAVNTELDATHGLTLQMRIGVNTGEVLAAGDAASGEPMVTGDVVNTAARLQTTAEPGEILAADRTRRAVRGFRFGERRDLALKGNPSRSWLRPCSADPAKPPTWGSAARWWVATPNSDCSAPCTSARPPKAGRTSSRSTATRGSARAG